MDSVVANSVGVSYPAINSDELVRLPVICPTDEEQGAIVAYLDRETEKIDALVNKRERLLELLQESEQPSSHVPSPKVSILTFR